MATGFASCRGATARVRNARRNRNRLAPRLVKAGAIGAIGLSEVAPDALRRAQDVHPIAAVQSEYSLWTRGPELGLIKRSRLGAIWSASRRSDAGTWAGLLQNVETFGDKDFRRVNPRFQGVNWRRNRDRLDAFLALAKTWELKPATLALAWTLAKAPHIVQIPGARAAPSRGMRRGGRDRPDRRQLAAIERALPVGFAAGERYSDQQWVGIQKY